MARGWRGDVRKRLPRTRSGGCPLGILSGAPYFLRLNGKSQPMTSLPPTNPFERPSRVTTGPRPWMIAAGLGALVLAGGVGGVVGAMVTQPQSSSATSLPGTAGNAPS